MADTDDAALPRYFAHAVRDDFLEPALVRSLFDYVESSFQRFEPTTVRRRDEARVDRTARISLGLDDMGPCLALLEQILRAAEPGLRAELGMGPYGLHDLELQLAAHNDGALFCRHGDTYKGWGTDRVISAVYYFHRQPCAFSGGALRLYPLTGEGYVEIEPVHNRLVAFPSFVEHEVIPVSCPSGLFMDSRFAVNCWFRRKPA